MCPISVRAAKDVIEDHSSGEGVDGVKVLDYSSISHNRTVLTVGEPVAVGSIPCSEKLQAVDMEQHQGNTPVSALLM